MSRIFWDSMLFVYLLEEDERYASRVAEILSRIHTRRDDLCTSALAFAEILVGPYKKGDTLGSAKVTEFFQSPFVRVLPFDGKTALHYANIRARIRVSPADAIHLACAASAGTDLFLTNDSSLLGKTVPGIQFIAGLNTDLF